MCGSLRRFAIAFSGAVALFVITARGQESPRPLAPGVLTVIPADAQPSETVTGPVAIPEIVEGMKDLKWTPQFAPESETILDRAAHTVFRRPVWCLEFAFKPLRMIDVDVPQSSGKMQRKRVWYLVYRVKNNGYDLNPTATPDKWGHSVYSVEQVNFKTRRFLPHIVLHSFEFGKEYLDRVIPSAQRAIEEREHMGIKLYNSVEISRVSVPLSDERVDRSIWGVAMWEDVDSRMDFFSINVGGLTNSFRLADAASDAAGAADAPNKDRRILMKTLQLNFWRPGDAVLEHESEFHFGIPIDADPATQDQILAKYGVKQRLDYVWVYR